MEYSDFAIELARAAGDVLKHYAAQDKQVEFKGRANLVTVADKKSEALIVREICSRYPDHAVLAEESGLLETSSRDSEYRWIIDPLDGTTNYAHQYPMYSVSIGLEIRGQIECGAVYDPVRDEMFSATRGGGAHLNEESIGISEVSSLGRALLLTGFPYSIQEGIGRALGLFRAFLLESQAVRRGGSAALDLCHPAMGRCDGFWELDLNPWDMAAGLVIVEEAGGRVTDFGGEPFNVESREVLASNGRIHDEMIHAPASAQSVDM